MGWRLSFLNGRVRVAGPILYLLPFALVAQGVPSMPSVGEELPVPSLGELLPLRPMALPEAQDRKVPIRLRGKNVQDGPDGWVLEEGGVESSELLLLADHIRYVAATGQLEAEGHIRLEGPDIRLRCARLRMDW